LEKRSIHREFGCFLRVENEDDLEKGFLVDETARNKFALFWKVVTGLEVEAFPYFRE